MRVLINKHNDTVKGPLNISYKNYLFDTVFQIAKRHDRSTYTVTLNVIKWQSGYHGNKKQNWLYSFRFSVEKFDVRQYRKYKAKLRRKETDEFLTRDHFKKNYDIVFKTMEDGRLTVDGWTDYTDDIVTLQSTQDINLNDHNAFVTQLEQWLTQR